MVIRMNVEEGDQTGAETQVQNEDHRQSAFALMLAASRGEKVLPTKYTNEHYAGNDCELSNDKVFFNDIVEWIDSLKLGWQSLMDANKTGKDFSTVLRDTLWEVDGHWHTLDERSCGVTVTLRVKFLEGYNRPESWSGKKRQHGNIILKKINQLQEKLFEHIFHENENLETSP